jgi:hypothetical protein
MGSAEHRAAAAELANAAAAAEAEDAALGGHNAGAEPELR